MINFQFFPRSHGVTKEIQAVIDCFKKIETVLDDGTHRVSNDVWHCCVLILRRVATMLSEEKAGMIKLMFLYYSAKITKLTNHSTLTLSIRKPAL